MGYPGKRFSEKVHHYQASSIRFTRLSFCLAVGSFCFLFVLAVALVLLRTPPPFGGEFSTASGRRGLASFGSTHKLGFIALDRDELILREERKTAGLNPGVWSGATRAGRQKENSYLENGWRRERKGNRPQVLAVVGIQTGFGSAERRRALRETWMPSTRDGMEELERSTMMVVRFVLGRSKDPKLEAAAREEAAKYHDFIRLDVEEAYLALTRKTLAFFRAAHALYDADFYVKADDDIYLRPDRLATFLAKERQNPRTYIGCMKKGPVITDPNLKWYEPQGYLIGSEYFMHAYGPIYALSAGIVATLAEFPETGLRMFNNEDVTIGAWMLALDVTYEDNRQVCEPECTANSIAVWDIPTCSGLCDPAKRLRELHSIDLCSKSSTVPEDT